jgi:undecaprenyl-diphosphatase
MQELLNLDHSLFHLINGNWTHPALDWFFSNWTDLHKTSFFLFVVVPVLLAAIYRFRKWEGLLFLLCALLATGISDWLFGKWMKPFFGRLRPPVAGLETILRAPHYGGYSFPSNHAANMFCLAAFAGFYFPRLRIPLFSIAALTAYSRVYCGVHFPSDVLAGALLGSLLGLGLAVSFKPLWIRVQQRLQTRETSNG